MFVIIKSIIIHFPIKFILEGVPLNIRLADVRKDLTSVDHVLSIHNVHVWALTAGKTVMSAHVVIGM